ncbi:MAG: DNA/RNA non-specific endonuclease [Bacteroidia bacterium]
MKYYKIFLCIITSLKFVYAQQQATITSTGKKVVLFDDGTWKFADSIPFYGIKPVFINNLHLPYVKQTDFVVHHTGFSLFFNQLNKQAHWVAYTLTKDKTIKSFERTNKFLPDPKIKSETANNNDYTNSGFDRGHLAPAADMAWSEKAMTESFYFSNISPQVPAFNRGIWKKLEEQFRLWAADNDTVYIATGPILSSALNTLGSSNVSIPEYFYKIILDYTEPDIKAIGFILPNKASSEPLQKFAVTIDSIESVTGIDFYYQLPDEHEKIIESTLCLPCWNWKDKFVDKTINDSEKNNSISVQCSGITKSGNRCKRFTSNKNGRCYEH